MNTSPLPEAFKGLEPFVEDWDLPGTNERYIKRMNSDFEDLTRFHKAIVERFDDIKSYLDSKPMDQFSEQDKCLGRLMFAFTTVAPAVESFKQVRVPDCESVPMFDVREEMKL